MKHKAAIVELDIPGLPAGLKMQLHDEADQIISARLRQDRCWENYETQLTLQHLKSGDVYVDVGANIGYYTLVAAQRVGSQGKVIAYEPDADNFALLKTNVMLNSLHNVQLFPIALYDKNADGKLFLSGDNFGDHRVYAANETRASREIFLVHGGEHLSQQTQKIDFLKIDTQGAEFFVMNGLRQLIMENRAHLSIMLEFCPYGIRHSGADGHDLVQLLEDIGMQLQIVDHQQECLIPAQTHHLSEWVTAMANEPDNEGFINLLLTPAASISPSK
jgi:FkbM family methyltransferase